MQLHLGGSLAWYDGHKRTNLEIVLEESISLETLLQRLSIPRAEVAMMVVNGELVAEDDVQVCNTDKVMFYPPVGGGRL